VRLLRQNWTYAAGPLKLTGLQATLTRSGGSVRWGAATDVSPIGAFSVFELVVSSHWVSVRAARAVSAAATTKRRPGGIGGGLFKVSGMGFAVAVMITPWCGRTGDSKKRCCGRFQPAYNSVITAKINAGDSSSERGAVEFRILGPLHVSREGRPLSLGGHRQKVLVCLLLLHANEVMAAEQIIDVLWGEAPSTTARKALQVYISRLRQLLGPGVLETRAPGYLIQVDDGELDVQRFAGLLAQGKHALSTGDPGRAAALLRRALALWRGPALADVMYEPFAQAEAGRLEELRLSCLEERIEADLALGRHADLVGELEVLTGRHPYREHLIGRLMLVLYRSGRQAEALEVYRLSRSRLVDELGIDPGPELRSLASRILNQDPSLDWEAPAASAEELIRPAGAFVGRERELTDLRHGLDDLQRGRGSLFLISGEPGIGKTALTEQFTAGVKEQDARVLVGRCWESGGAPAYWPWVQCLRTLARESELGVLARQLGPGAADLAEIIPELREVSPDLPRPLSADAEGLRFRLFDAVTTLLRTEAAATPLVLVLEDLHAADASSLLLLRFVAQTLNDTPLQIIATTRSAERTASESFTSTLAELARGQRLHHIRLTGLSREEVADFVAATSDIAAREGLSDRIYTRTDGHPFFVSEIVHLLGTDTDVDVLPPGVRAVVSQRLSLLSEECQELLATASVLGRDFRSDVVATVCGVEPAYVVDHLQEAIAISMLYAVPSTPGHYHFSHELVREVLYDGLPGTRAMTLHRRAAEALESIYSSELDPHTAELAHHFAIAAPTGTAVKAVRYAARAAQRALNQLAYEESVSLYTTALRAHELEADADAEARCELLLALGDAQTSAGDTTAAHHSFVRAADIAREAGWAEMLARAALGYGGRFVWEPDAEPSQPLAALLDETLRALPEDSPLRARVLARYACAVGWYAGGPVEARRQLLDTRSREAVDIARRLGDPATLSWALTARFLIILGPDHLEEMVALGDEIVTVAEQAGAWDEVANGLAFRYEVRLTHGEIGQAQADLARHIALAEELKLRSQSWHAGTHQAELLLLLGRFAEAATCIGHMFNRGAAAHRNEALKSAAIQRWLLFLEQGGFQEPALEELRSTLDRLEADRPNHKIYPALLARLDCELGQERRARARLDVLAMDGFHTVSRDYAWLMTLTLLADVAARVGNPDQIKTLYELLRPYAAFVVGAEHIRFGSVARYLGLLAAALSRLDEAAQLLQEAVQANDRIGALSWSAHSKADLARVLLARDAPGDRETAEGLFQQALATYQNLGMASAATRLAAVR
jgi:DNA-binding SARP family transcriptional activator/tetratricopeptide (TPR) repeat protein